MSECVSGVEGRARERRADSSQKKGTKVRVSVRETASQAEILGFLCVCVLFQIGSLWLQQQIHTRQAGMREREELRRAIEQSERLLSKVRQLEEQNTQINKEKNEVATKYQAVSLLLCSAASLPFVSPSLSSVFPL